MDYNKKENYVKFPKINQPLHFEYVNYAELYLPGKLAYQYAKKFENIPTKKLFSRILKEKMSGKNAGEIGLNFHYTLIKVIEKIAEGFAVKEIAFSGGVWQNALLVDLAIEVLGDKFTLHFHEKLSPNDENISFGQLNYYLNYLKFEV